MFVEALRLKHHSMSEQKLGKIMEALLNHMLDDSKSVQRAACGAVANFCPHVSEHLHLWLDLILKALTQALALDGYQLSVLPQLIDVAVELVMHLDRAERAKMTQLQQEFEAARQSNDAAAVQQAQQKVQNLQARSIRRDDVVHALVEPLLKRWEAFGVSAESQDTSEFVSNQYDSNIFRVLECLNFFIRVFGGTTYFQAKYLKGVAVESLKLCIGVKQEVRDWRDEFVDRFVFYFNSA